MWSPTYPESHISGVPLILESHLWLIPSFSNISNFLDRDLAEVVNMASKFYGEFNKICSTSLMRRENKKITLQIYQSVPTENRC